MEADVINGLFEGFGSILLWKNVSILLKDKEVKGVHWIPTSFFFLWGIWNLYYYPHLNQMWSFLGGCSIVLANGAWLGLMIYYGKVQKWSSSNGTLD